LVDVQGYLDTLRRVEEMKGLSLIPAHAPAGEDLSLLARKNIEKVEEILELVVSLCREPCCLEDVIQKVFSHYQLTMDFTQYALVGSTLRSYVSYLRNQGRIEPFFQENRLLWRAV
ncbi:MAG: MBL fold metallo-hydrolase, partial [Blautia sp.]|nr:MBL fold metallo-hydrolase [Blautia sp.]